MSSGGHLSLIVPGTVGHLAQIRDFVTVNAQDAGFSQADVDEVVLALDEAVANIVEHAYEGSTLPPGERQIKLSIDCEDGLFRVLLQDRGVPYDPTQAPQLTAEESALKGARGDDGGWGLYIIRQFMDDIRYRYSPEEGNVLEMVRRVRRA